MDTLEKSTPLFQKIDLFIDQAFDRFSEHAVLVAFVINELEHHPEKTEDIFEDVKAYDSAVLDEQLNEAASNYEIAPAQSNQVVTNMLSLCMFPFVGRAFLKQALNMGDQVYREFMDRRREVVKDTIINALAS